MKSSWFEKFKWLISVIKEMRKNSYPLTTKGVKLMLYSLASAPASGILIQFLIPEKFIINTIDISVNEATFLAIGLCALTWLIGLALIIFELRLVTNAARKSARVLITGLPGTSTDFPSEVLDKAEQRLAREPIELSIEESSSYDHSGQVTRYNAELCVDLFKRFILHNDCQKLYIGGLARIPFLVAYGAFLRNITSQVLYFDKFHRKGNWNLLNQENCDIKFSNYKLITDANENGDIGVAIGFSAPISNEQLPIQLAGFTTILKPNTNIARNLIKNQENLEQISEAVRDIIDELSRQPTCKRIHLFLSVQSSFAIELGRRYQEGTQCNWVIHNYDFDQKKYNWALELSKSEVKEFTF